MKRIILPLLAWLMCAIGARAIMAYPWPVTVEQPDGTTLTLVGHGDERRNFTTTADGFTVMRTDAGVWEYAVLDGARLAPSGRTAREPMLRSAADERFLLTLPQYLTAPRRPAVMRAQGTGEASGGVGAALDRTKFRGLVILIEFNDRSFSLKNASEVFTDMMNKEGYTGYESVEENPSTVPYTGSVRDYFRDNSMGQFAPEFDVYGPVRMNVSQYYVNQVNMALPLFWDVLNQADSMIDYSKYDADGDGAVDMVYFITAGAGSNYTGNDQRLLWPHASSLESIETPIDGVRFGRYACSTELTGRDRTGLIDGIGIICHEFSHVLGIADLYDTDYSGSGGQSVHPANWSVMASGGYLNSSRTPCGYSLYERYAMGFTTPEPLTETGDYTLPYLGTSNKGYRIDTPNKDEYFLLENRTLTKWDAKLPGPGMLVFRVDSTDVSVWEDNVVNANPAHNYYELLRAAPRKILSSIYDSGGDPFPGTSSVTALSAATTPALTTWDGKDTGVTLSDITRAEDGTVTFHAEVNPKGDSSVDMVSADGAGPALDVRVFGNRLVVSGLDGRRPLVVHDLSGRMVAQTADIDADGRAELNVGCRGLYIVSQGQRAVKVVL